MFVHLPTLFAAILTRSNYIYILALIGFASLAADCVLKTSNPPNAYGYITGALVALLMCAYCIYRTREHFHNKLVGWLSACARHTCAIEEVTDDEDEMNTTGLLANEEAEEA